MYPSEHTTPHKFDVVAHRGVTDEVPENTIAAFERAIALGADGIEMDVQLTSDGVPVVYHYFYLDEMTTAHGPLCARSWAELQQVEVVMKQDDTRRWKISRLDDILEATGGRIGLEIELKSPAPEIAATVCDLLKGYRALWESIEVTSYHAALLVEVRRRCPGLATDLLFPRSEAWMGIDAVMHQAVQTARLAQARAIHLHPSQLTPAVTAAVRAHGVDVHAWDINDPAALDAALQAGVSRICSDKIELMLCARKNIN